MDIAGLVTVGADEGALLDELADMVGTCFREEMWYVRWLEALDADEARKLAITRASIRADYAETAPYGCVYTLPDHAGAANVYLRSALRGTSWPELEERAAQRMEDVLSPAEQEALLARGLAMEAVSDTAWPLEVAAPDEDFLYFISAGVDPARRSTGAFRRLFTPFLDAADERGIACYLDCYTERLEQLYGHFGFEVVGRNRDDALDLEERLMVRRPHTAG